MSLVRRSIKFSFMEKYATFGITFVSTIILARLLTPHDIGIFSVGLAFIGLAHTLRDFGVTSYLIQEQDLSTEKIRTALTITILISWVLAIVLLLGAPLAAAFYDEPGVEQVLRVVALNFFVIPISAPILALWRRDFKFGRLAAVNLAGSVASATTAITLAWMGLGFMSLAWASFVHIVVTASCVLATRPPIEYYRPSLASWRNILGFGGYYSGISFVGDLTQIGPDLMIGRILGFEALGLFSRAMGLIKAFSKIIFAAVSPVLLPAFSATVRVGDDLKPSYLLGSEIMSALFWPYLAVSGLLAEPLIRFLFGEPWVPAAPVYQVLCIGFAIAVQSFMVRPLLVALGRLRQALLLHVITTTALLLSVLVFAQFGLELVGIAWGFFYLAFFAISHVLLNEAFGITLREVAKAFARSGLATAAAALPPSIIVLGGWTSHQPLLVLTVGGTMASVSWLAMIFWTDHPLSHEIRIICSAAKRAILVPGPKRTSSEEQEK